VQHAELSKSKKGPYEEDHAARSQRIFFPEPRRLGLRQAKKGFRNEARWQTNTENN
jgi:hypothetical protein